MTHELLLKRHGFAKRFVRLNPHTGEARPCTAPSEVSSVVGQAHCRYGKWYALYTSGDGKYVQAGRFRCKATGLRVNELSSSGLIRRLRLVFQGEDGPSELQVQYLRPLSYLFDGTFDVDDDLASDFFLWLHVALREEPFGNET